MERVLLQGAAAGVGWSRLIVGGRTDVSPRHLERQDIIFTHNRREACEREAQFASRILNQASTAKVAGVSNECSVQASISN